MANDGERKRVESASVYSRARNTPWALLFGCNPSMKGRASGFGAATGGGGKQQKQRREDGWTPVRILRSACVSQYPSRPKLDFRNSRWRASDHAVHLGLLAPVSPEFSSLPARTGPWPTNDQDQTHALRSSRETRSVLRPLSSRACTPD